MKIRKALTLDYSARYDEVFTFRKKKGGGENVLSQRARNENRSKSSSGILLHTRVPFIKSRLRMRILRNVVRDGLYRGAAVVNVENFRERNAIVVLARCCDSDAQHSASLNGIQGAKVSVQRSASNGSAARQEIIYEPSN